MKSRGTLSSMVVGTVPAVIAVLIVAALLHHAWYGQGSVSGDPWVETALVAFAASALVVVAFGLVPADATYAVRRYGVLAGSSLTLLSFAYFRLSPLVSGESWGFPIVGADRLFSLDLVRAAAMIAPLVVAFLLRRMPWAPAAAAVGVSIAAVLLAVPKLKEADPHHYLGTLRPVRLEDDTHFRIGDARFELQTRDGNKCVLHGPARDVPLGTWAYGDTCRLGCGVEAAETVYVDPRGDYAVVYQHEYTGPYMGDVFGRVSPLRIPSDACSNGNRAVALRVADGARVELGGLLLRDRLSAPRLMLYLAAIGELVALGLFVLAIRRRHFEGAHGVHEGDGAVRIKRDLVQVPAAAALAAGPVVLTGEVKHGASVFRGARTFTGAYTPDLARAAWLESATIAVALISAAPLVGAHLAGL